MNIEKLDYHRSIDEVVRRDTGCDRFVLVAINDTQFSTYVSENIEDMQLVYIIQMMKDARQREFGECCER